MRFELPFLSRVPIAGPGRLNRPNRCDLDPSRVAVWHWDEQLLRLSAFAAQTLIDAGKLELSHLALHRSKEYETRRLPKDPSRGGVTEILRTVTNSHPGIAQIFEFVSRVCSVDDGVANTLMTLVIPWWASSARPRRYQRVIAMDILISSAVFCESDFFFDRRSPDRWLRTR